MLRSDPSAAASDGVAGQVFGGPAHNNQPNQLHCQESDKPKTLTAVSLALVAASPHHRRAGPNSTQHSLNYRSRCVTILDTKGKGRLRNVSEARRVNTPTQCFVCSTMPHGGLQMSEGTYLLIGVLGVVLVVSVLALVIGKNLRQELRLPWIRWKMKTGDSGSKSPHNVSKVDFGKDNEFDGDVGDVAGRDIVRGDGTQSQPESSQSSVNMGTGNEFDGSLGDIAGRDVRENQ